jgi:hypothetical protein
LKKNIYFVCVLTLVLIVFGVINVYAEWMNCSDYWGGRCDQGGCEGAEDASDCIFEGCTTGPLVCMIKPKP